MIKICYDLLFALSMTSHLSCRMGMGGIRELLDGKIWEWDLSFRWEWEWSHWNGRELVRKICSRTPLVELEPCLQLSTTVVGQVNETMMLSIVTDRESDYIFVTDFDAFGEHIDDIINQACRTLPPSTLSPSSTPPSPVGESTLQFLDTLLMFSHATPCSRGISCCRCRCLSVNSRYRIQILNGSRWFLAQKFHGLCEEIRVGLHQKMR